MRKSNGALVIFLVLLLLLSLYSNIIERGKNTNLSEVITALQDSIVREKKKNGQEIARRKAIEAELEDLKIIVIQNDSTIERLKDIAGKRTLSAVSIDQVTQSHAVIDEVSVANPDSTVCDPVYSGEENNEWAMIKVLASNDSIVIDYRIYDEIDVWFDRHGKETYAYVRNNNPNTTLINQRAFVVPEKKSTTCWKIAGGIGVIVGYLLARKL